THNLRLLDNDCFKVNVSGGSDLKVTINGILSRDVDVEIYDDSVPPRQLVGGISGANTETVYISDVASGGYFIVVPYWRSQGLQNAYSLTVETGDFGIGEITGLVTEDPSGLGIEVRVNIYDLNSPKRWHTFTRDNGSYSISLPPGDYKFFFDSRPWDYFPYQYQGFNYVNEWYDNKPTSSRAAIVSVQTDQTISDINAQLKPGGLITGRITDTEGIGLERILVRDWGGDGRTLSYTYSDADGYYSLERL
ncbi:MAG: hypothetical protein GTO54_06230, partial [Nitrososphaeria archaeon]|nr:hypothetical protein [Nitrososphaeria archaeon]